jgi:anti-anti-sigma regulatory factor
MALFIPSNLATVELQLAALEAGRPAFRYVKGRMQGDVLVLEITAPQLLDDVLADGFAGELHAAMACSRARKVVLNLAEVKAACSGAFAALLDLQQALCGRGGRLVLCGLSGPLVAAFHIAGLTAAPGLAAPLETRPDVPAALACLDAAAGLCATAG